MIIHIQCMLPIHTQRVIIVSRVTKNITKNVTYIFVLFLDRKYIYVKTHDIKTNIFFAFIEYNTISLRIKSSTELSIWFLLISLLIIMVKIWDFIQKKYHSEGK